MLQAIERLALPLHINFVDPILKKSGRVTLSSGDYKTMHADFFNTWDHAKLEELVKTRINAYDPARAQPPECTALRVVSEVVATRAT